VYYPGTEGLRPDEIRVTCCGSGLPAARRGSAAICWLIECGNGELQEQVIEAQGPMMREFWEKWDVPLAPDVKKAYGVEDGDAARRDASANASQKTQESYVARPLIH